MNAGMKWGGLWMVAFFGARAAGSETRTCSR